MIKTDKDAFDFVVQKLTEQNEKSINEADICQYRGISKKTIDEIIKQALEVSGGDEESDEYELEYYNLLESAPRDAKCAVGHLILDSFYDPYFEDSDFTNFSVEEAVRKSNPEWEINQQSREMLMNLQGIHDSKQVHDWPAFFAKMNAEFNEDGSYSGGLNTYYSSNLFVETLKDNDPTL